MPHKPNYTRREKKLMNELEALKTKNKFQEDQIRTLQSMNSRMQKGLEDTEQRNRVLQDQFDSQLQQIEDMQTTIKTILKVI